MNVGVPFLLIYLFTCMNAEDNFTVINEEKQCHGQLKKEQNKLDIFIKRLEDVAKNSKFPSRDGPSIEKIKIIKNFIRKLKKLSEQDKALDHNILSNLYQNVNAFSRLEKIEKRIHEYKMKKVRNKKVINQLEDILKSIRTIDANLTIYNNTCEICEEAEDAYNKFTEDVNIISETYRHLNNVINQYRQRQKDLTSELAHIEGLLDDIKIPQSYISNYLCHKENQLQKTIDENFQALDYNTDLLDEIITEINNKGNTKQEEITDISNLAHSLNTDLTTVYDILKIYEREIPEKISIEELGQNDIVALQNDVKDLDDAISKLLSSLNVFDKNSFLEEYERKLNVLYFILGDENMETIKNEIRLFEDYNLRIHKLINAKTMLEVQIEDIEQLVKELMNQKVCRSTGSEDSESS